MKFLLFLSAFMIISIASFAQDGSLDNSFDADGILVTGIENYSIRGESVAIQSDGKIVVAGTGASTTGGPGVFAVARYNSDGTLDSTFDSDGKLVTSFENYNPQGRSVAIQSDGKIVVAGIGNSATDPDAFVLARYNSNGTLDSTFGTGGKLVTIDALYDIFGQSVAIQSDGKIVVAGSAFGITVGVYLIEVARYNSDGTLDNTFSTDGLVTTNVAVYFANGSSVAIQSDGKIVVTGSAFSTNGYPPGAAMVRLNSDGTFDNTFGGNGKFAKVIPNYTIDGQSVIIQSDGKIVTAGNAYSSNGGPNGFAVLRYNSNGTPDNTFDNDGFLVTTIGGFNIACESAAIQSDGKIVVTGTGGPHGFVVVRYNSDGTLDNTFDADGSLVTIIPNYKLAGGSVAIQNDGKIVVAGKGVTPGIPDQHVVVRYNSSVSTGLEDAEDQLSKVKVYPNPFSKQVTIELLENEQSTFSLFDFTGGIIMQEKISSSTILNTEQLAEGIYFYELKSSKGIIRVGKIVKQ